MTHVPEPDGARSALADRLRADDPVRSTPAAREGEILTRLAHRIAAVEPRRPTPRGRLGWLPVATALLLAVGLGWRWRTARPDGEPPDARRATPALEPVGGPAPSSSGRTRQLQFETPGGTRIVWVLDPDLSL